MLFFIYGLSACSADQKVVNIAVSKQGKVYLYSLMGKQVAELQINQGDMPTIMKSTLVIPEKDVVFMSPSHLAEIANILGGNYSIIEKKEKSFDGYVVLENKKLFNQQFQNEDSGEIGKMIGKMTVSLTKSNTDKPYEIIWQIKPEQEAIKNCEVKSLWMKSTVPTDGDTYYSEDHVLVNLNDIIQFYNSKAKVIYNEGAELLYIYLEE